MSKIKINLSELKKIETSKSSKPKYIALEMEIEDNGSYTDY